MTRLLVDADVLVLEFDTFDLVITVTRIVYNCCAVRSFSSLLLLFDFTLHLIDDLRDGRALNID